jgi:hypothetical protein
MFSTTKIRLSKAAWYESEQSVVAGLAERCKILQALEKLAEDGEAVIPRPDGYLIVRPGIHSGDDAHLERVRKTLQRATNAGDGIRRFHIVQEVMSERALNAYISEDADERYGLGIIAA